jgi:hypothetical protein
MNVLLGNVVDAAASGITPGADCTAAFQNLVDTAPAGTWLQLPPGLLTISSTIDFTSAARRNLDGKNTEIRLLGCGKQVTKISGGKAGVAGPLLSRNAGLVTGSGSVWVRGISLLNNHTQGLGFQGEFLNSSRIEDCDAKANIGFAVGLIGDPSKEANVAVAFDGCDAYGDYTLFPNGVGFSTWMMGSIRNCQAIGVAGTGMQVSGSCSVDEARIEECGTGLLSYNNSAHSILSRINTEACRDRHIAFGKGGAGTLWGANVGGDRFRGTTWPTTGLEIGAGSGRVTVHSSSFGGSFSAQTVLLAGDGPLKVINSVAGNKGFAGSTQTVLNTMADGTYFGDPANVGFEF